MDFSIEIFDWVAANPKHMFPRSRRATGGGDYAGHGRGFEWLLPILEYREKTHGRRADARTRALAGGPGGGGAGYLKLQKCIGCVNGHGLEAVL